MTYFVDDHEDTMARLCTGKATEGDQMLVYKKPLHWTAAWHHCIEHAQEEIDKCIR